MIKKRLASTLQLGMAVFMMLFATNLVPIAGSVAFADELTESSAVTETGATSAAATENTESTELTTPVNDNVTTPANNGSNSVNNDAANRLSNIANSSLNNVNNNNVANNNVNENVIDRVPERVTICHATDSATNPYVKITVDADAADGNTGNDNGRGDHSTHTGPVATSQGVAQALKDAHIAWGDIIPPHHNYAGLNWTAAGQAIYNNNCNAPLTPVTPAAVTFNDVCGTEDDTYTVPTTAGVTYKVGGVTKAAGTYAGTGSVTVTAHANEGFTLTGATSWSHTFTNEECPEEDRVTICHRTSAVSNPYVRITVAVSAVDGDQGNNGGQGDHFLEHTGPVFNNTMQQGDSWGDIIPPIAGVHSGLNWTAEGQAIYNNNCEPATVTVIDVCPNVEGVQTTVPNGLVKVGELCLVPDDNGTVLGASTVATIIKAPAPVVGGQGQLVDTGENPLVEMLIGLTIFSLAIGSAILTRKVTPQTN